MARIVIELPDALNADLGAAICQQDGYQPTVEVDGKVVENPMKPSEFVAQKFLGWAANYLHNYRRPVDISKVSITFE